MTYGFLVSPKIAGIESNAKRTLVIAMALSAITNTEAPFF